MIRKTYDVPCHGEKSNWRVASKPGNRQGPGALVQWDVAATGVEVEHHLGAARLRISRCAPIAWAAGLSRELRIVDLEYFHV